MKRQTKEGKQAAEAGDGSEWVCIVHVFVCVRARARARVRAQSGDGVYLEQRLDPAYCSKVLPRFDLYIYIRLYIYIYIYSRIERTLPTPYKESYPALLAGFSCLDSAGIPGRPCES
jgi:hypothetical protein